MTKILITIILALEACGFTDPCTLGETPGFRVANYLFG